MNDYPTVLIIGRPNVGKSSLFNLFVKRDTAIVSETMGSTLDNHYAWTEFNGLPCCFIDTAGYNDKEQSSLHQTSMAQCRQIINSADVILFVVDNQSGLTTLDHLILKQIRVVSPKHLWLIINKMDHKEDSVHPDMYGSGIEHSYHVSSRCKMGFKILSNALHKLLSTLAPAEKKIDDDRFRIGFIGKPNAGKSSLINSILKSDHRIVSDIPGTTRDISETPISIANEVLWLTDTAGIRRKKSMDGQIEQDSVLKAIKSIKQCPLVIFLIRADIGITDQDKKLMQMSAATNQGIIVVLTQTDRITSDFSQHMRALRYDVQRYVPFCHLIECSIYHPKSISRLEQEIIKTKSILSRQFRSSELTSILNALVELQEPPRTNVSRIKCRFAHPDKKPRSVIIKGKQVSKLPKSYKRYLLKGFVSHLKLFNTNFSLKFIDDHNPYQP